MRLIDADALYEFCDDQIEKETGAYTRGKNKALNIVKSALHNECAAPTVQPEPEWISVKDRLPDESGTYLVYAPTYCRGSSSGLDNVRGVMFARWRKHWSIEVGYHKRPGCVTHWMPLPEPPKEEV